MKSVRIVRGLGLAIPVLLPVLGHTADSQPVEIAPVVVTATRTAQTTDQALASVSVITRADLERRQSRNLGDALRDLPGAQLSNNGGEGKATSLFLRGTESDHVIVLIDGHKVGSATLGTAPFQDIPVDQIDRIEVVRGPRSALYGSEAIGGVVQIFTRKGDRTGKSLSATLGSFDTAMVNGSFTGGDKDRWFSISATGKQTDGYDSCIGDLGAGCFADQPDDDGYRNKSLSLRGGIRLTEDTEIGLQAMNSRSDSRFDGGFQDESDTITQVVGGSLDTSVTEDWTVSLKLSNTRDRSNNFLNGAFSTSFSTERENLGIQNDIVIGEVGLMTIGMDYLDERVSSTTAYTVSERANKGLFAQYQAEYSGHDLQLAVRTDDNEQFGGWETGNLGWGYSLANGMRLTASYGTAFKTPTFNELFFPGFGNPNLDPERSRSLELGVAGEHFDTRWSLNAYETNVKNQIAFDATFTPQNIAAARIRGVELNAARKLFDWDVAAGLTLMDPENRSDGANNGNLLNRRSQQSFSVDLDRSFGRYDVGATVKAVGKRYDDLANTNELASFVVLDLRAQTELDKHWQLQARIDNALDEEYETARRFRQPGRGFYVTIRYSDF